MQALTKIHHISTAYVYGNYTGVFTENDLDVGQKLIRPTRLQNIAELMVNEFRGRGLWINVYRPSIVIGESSTGKTFQLKHIINF